MNTVVRELELDKILNINLSDEAIYIRNYFKNLFEDIVVKKSKINNNIYLLKNDEIIMGQNTKFKLFICESNFWNDFKLMKYKYNDNDIKHLIKYFIKDFLQTKIFEVKKNKYLFYSIIELEYIKEFL